jgi:hypothetical protein
MIPAVAAVLAAASDLAVAVVPGVPAVAAVLAAASELAVAVVSGVPAVAAVLAAARALLLLLSLASLLILMYRFELKQI